jgi:non-specific serine/threonine protein kinase
LTSFIGREREIAEVGALLDRQRLVTLVGAPGVGKTRLSLQIAANKLEAFSDGVWLVELAPLADPALVPQSVAGVLGVPEQPGRTLAAILAEWLRSRHLLLLLDNCEHLITDVATLADALLQTCPALHLLATSREPLAVEGEVTWRVPSLTVHGGTGGAIDGEDAVRPEAVRLFVERAQAVAPRFALTKHTAPTVAQICARLDGVPLAIELAAARVRTLSVEQIATRLGDRFRLLTGGRRTDLPRQQTLRGAVDWSYELLAEPERALLRRLGVFAGGFTLEAAEQVGGLQQPTDTGTADDSADATLDLLTALADKSLIQVEHGDDGARRYSLLETLREYGLEKLDEHGELEASRDRHRDYFLTFAEEVAPVLNERADCALLSRLEWEHDNLRAALGWCLDESTARDQKPAGAALAVRLAAAIWRFWWLHGYLAEGSRWLARALAGPPSDSSPAGVSARATALLGVANLSAYQGDYRAAVTFMTENLSFCREAGYDRGVIFALQRLGFYLTHLGEGERGVRLCEESVALARQMGHPATLAAALHSSAIVANYVGRYEQSVILSEEAVDLLRDLGNVTVIAYALRTQSLASAQLGDLTRAVVLAEDGLRISQEVGDTRGIGESYKDLGRLALLTGDVDRAGELLRLSISIAQQLGERWLTARCLYILGGVEIVRGTRSPGGDVASPSRTDGAHGRFLDATRLFAAADLLREQDGLILPPDVYRTYDRDVALLREHLGEVAFSQARAEGRTLSFEQAIESALATMASSEPVTAVTPSDATSSPTNAEVARLTAREREVTVLVMRGLTNRQIADELVLQESTVHTHIHNILGKLELTSRAQVAVWAVEHGLVESP